VSKANPRVAAYGAVDELNTAIGLVLAQGYGGAESDLLLRIQNELFDLGADLCVPQREGEAAGSRLRLTGAHVTHLERAIDRLNAALQPIKSFVLPGGTPAAAWLHQARVVCRRAERETVALAEHEPVNPLVLTYLNRLSDLLFVMARAANDGGARDVLWQPGGTVSARKGRWTSPLQPPPLVGAGDPRGWLHLLPLPGAGRGPGERFPTSPSGTARPPSPSCRWPRDRPW